MKNVKEYQEKHWAIEVEISSPLDLFLDTSLREAGNHYMQSHK